MLVVLYVCFILHIFIVLCNPPQYNHNNHNTKQFDEEMIAEDLGIDEDNINNNDGSNDNANDNNNEEVVNDSLIITHLRKLTTWTPVECNAFISCAKLYYQRKNRSQTEAPQPQPQQLFCCCFFEPIRMYQNGEGHFFYILKKGV